MKTITKFKANDDVPKAVEDGKGWVHHNRETVIKCMQGILDLCKPDFSEQWPAFNAPAEKVHPLSIIGRIPEADHVCIEDRR